MKRAINEYEDALGRYIPVLMAQAKIYWDLEMYQQVEKLFRKSVEFCNESDIWKLNVAHVLFMQENKFKEATGFYEPIVRKNFDRYKLQSLQSIIVQLQCFFLFQYFECICHCTGKLMRIVHYDLAKRRG